MAINVPLNGALADVDPSGVSDIEAARRAYEGPWVFWNRARTAALVLLLGALYAEGRHATDPRP